MNVPANYNQTNIDYEIPLFSDAEVDGSIEDCFEDIKPIRVWEIIIVGILALEILCRIIQSP